MSDGLEAGAVVACDRVIGIGGIDASLEQRAARRDERHDIVDVAVGAVVFDDAVGQPHDALGPEVGAKRVLDPRPVPTRIAIVVQQTPFSGDERAGSVGHDRPAFEHERRLHARKAELRGDQCADRLVVLHRRELAAPAVEPEVHGDARAVGAAHDDRARVPEPRVVDRQLHDVDRIVAQGTGAVCLRRVRDHRHRLETGDLTGDVRVGEPGAVEGRVPELLATRLGRPRHERALVRVRLRRHARPAQDVDRHRAQATVCPPASESGSTNRRRADGIARGAARACAARVELGSLGCGRPARHAQSHHGRRRAARPGGGTPGPRVLARDPVRPVGPAVGHAQPAEPREPGVDRAHGERLVHR